MGVIYIVEGLPPAGTPKDPTGDKVTTHVEDHN
jgi:hypothetical protein